MHMDEMIRYMNPGGLTICVILGDFVEHLHASVTSFIRQMTNNAYPILLEDLNGMM